MPNEEGKRKTEPREDRLLAEYLAKHYPRDRVLFRVRLGSPPISPGVVPLDAAEKKILKNWARWADALVITKTDLILIEAEIIPTPGIVSTLQLYKNLLLGDSDYKDILHLPVTMRAVWAFDDPSMRAIAHRNGVEVVIFGPPWVRESLAERFKTAPRLTRPPKPGGV